MLGAQNQVICWWFSICRAIVVYGPVKVVKIQLKYFSAVLMKNSKNCTLNIVGMFWVQT